MVLAGLLTFSVRFTFPSRPGRRQWYAEPGLVALRQEIHSYGDSAGFTPASLFIPHQGAGTKTGCKCEGIRAFRQKSF